MAFTFRVLVVSEKNTLKDDMVIWDYLNAPKSCKDFYIGHIVPSFYKHYLEIDDVRIRQLKYIFSEAVFNKKQIKELAKEIEILEELGLGDKEDLDIIKIGIKIALSNNLYLRFKHD